VKPHLNQTKESIVAKDKTAPVQPAPAPWATKGPEKEESVVAESTEESETQVNGEEPSGDVEEAPVQPAPALVETPVVGELVDMVTATVPKAFTLRLDHFREINFKAGVQEMERSHAEHWYSKANGVMVYKPRKEAAE
jgi:hypothetical protein